MTVAELTEKLKQLDPAMPVAVWDRQDYETVMAEEAEVTDLGYLHLPSGKRTAVVIR